MAIWFVAVLVCGHFGCGHFGLWPFWIVAVLVYGHFGLWPFWFVAILDCGRFDLRPLVIYIQILDSQSITSPT